MDKAIHKHQKWLKIILCFGASAACAALFSVSMGLLPASPCPAWLPATAAVCGGGLSAWFCFGGWREKSLRRWGLRLLAIACAAMLLTLCTELFGNNFRSFVTRDCTPVKLFNDNFLVPGDIAGDLGEERELLLVKDDDTAATIFREDLSIDTVAIAVTLTGDAKAVPFQALIHDAADSVYDGQATEGVIVPSVPGLDTFYGALYSNGPLNMLKLVFELEDDQEAAVVSVTLNPNVPVRWQPIRMALVFLAAVLVLCLLRFPVLGLNYDRRRASHRLAIILPMIALMALNVTLAVYCAPKNADGTRELWNGRAVEEVQTDQQDGYGMLFAAFLKGQLHLLVEPDPVLLALSNPYDRGLRGLSGVDWLPDCALYEGHYYVYFGPGPVLLCYFPYYWLTGKVPSDLLCGVFLSLLAIPLIYLAVMGAVRRYGGKTNLVLLSLGCFTLTCVAGWPRLLTSAARYENVVAMNIAMMAGALDFGLYAVMERRPRRRVCLFLLCGVCFALQSMCRANILLLTTALLAPPFVGLLRDKRLSLKSRLRDGACFLIPAALGVCAVMWYNNARFGSVAEFGQLHQLTMEDIHYNSFRAEYIPQALFHYFLDMPSFAAVFPYVEQRVSFVNVTGNDFWYDVNVGMLAYPLLWLLPLAGVGLKACRSPGVTRQPELMGERRAMTVIPVILVVGLIVVSYFYAGVLQRYTHDFLMTLGLIALLCGFALHGEARKASPLMGKAWFIVLALLCLCSVALSLCFGFSNERMFIEKNSPELYYGLMNMLFPY